MEENSDAGILRWRSIQVFRRKGEGEFRCMNSQVGEYFGLGAFRGRRRFWMGNIKVEEHSDLGAFRQRSI